MSWQQPDYYAVLGVWRSASAADLDRAYRRAARATHPDVHPDDTSAAERFHAVTIAYETLSDPGRRASYDRAHPAAAAGEPVRVVVHRRRPTGGAPVPLGRHRTDSVPLQPLRLNGPDLAGTDDLLELARALSRAFFDWPLR